MKLFKLYRKSQEVQLNWIRQHPVQYIALNAIVLTVFIGYIEYKDRKEFGPLEEETVAPE
jgi:hypothetical protein